MKRGIFLLAMALGAVGLRAGELLPIEREVEQAIEGPVTTVVHFWAPWCSNCYGELKSGGWSSFITKNKDVKVIFITSWTGEAGDGRAILEKAGVGAQKNFRLLVHPNASRRDDDKMRSFLGLPVQWLPATWVFREGKLRYALNYGEVRFEVLQQLVDDTMKNWDL